MRQETSSVPSSLRTSGCSSKAWSTGRNSGFLRPSGSPPADAAGASSTAAASAAIQLAGFMSVRRLDHPIQVLRMPAVDRECDDLGQLVRMVLQHGLLEGLEPISGGLYQEQRFAVLVNLALPAVHRVQARDHVD